MRTVRLSLVGTVMLVLLGGLSDASTLAQSPSPLAQGDEDAPVWVTLLTSENGRVEGGPGIYEQGAGLAKRIRDLRLAEDRTYSDARLDGTQHYLYSEDCFEHGICIGWGTMEIVGSEGTTWSGWWHEIDDHPKDNTTFHIVLTGTGPYEGLTAILFSRGVWEQFPDAEYGVIYRGDPPPGPEELLTPGWRGAPTGAGAPAPDGPRDEGTAHTLAAGTVLSHWRTRPA